MVEQAGGKPVMSKTGHAFIKQAMREANAIYGGEMSAHHYFSSFAYCDNGTIPWLLICQLISDSKKQLSQLVQERMLRFPCSGEINLKVANASAVLEGLQQHYQTDAVLVDHIDGLGVEMANWRFNVRSSNTEPLLRVNVESRGDTKLMQAKTQEILDMIENLA